jgi:hypothetical protein
LSGRIGTFACQFQLPSASLNFAVTNQGIRVKPRCLYGLGFLCFETLYQHSVEQLS